MPQKKHKPEEIVAKLRQVDVLLSQGRSVGEAVRSIGVTQFIRTCAGGPPAVASAWNMSTHTPFAAQRTKRL